jgi:hypothetical protein
MKFRNPSALRAGLYSLLVRTVFLAPQLGKAGPLVSKQDVISIVDDNASIRGAIKRLIESAKANCNYQTRHCQLFSCRRVRMRSQQHERGNWLPLNFWKADR